MCRRKLSKLQRSLFCFLFYLTIYLLLSYAMTPEATYTFVSDDVRVGDKYAFMYLVAPKMPVFSDVAGAGPFGTRCGKCFVTNNKGFMPLKEYDAILILGNRSILSEASSFLDIGKKYLLETSEECVRDKLRGCAEEPRITSFLSRESYDLCSLCQDLHERRKPTE